MEKPLVDPLVLVGYLLAEFDDSERMANEIRRAMLRAVGGLPTDHPVRETIESIACNLTVVAVAIGGGLDGDVYRSQMVEQWQGVARRIEREPLH